MLKTLIGQFRLKGLTGMEDTMIYKPADFDNNYYDFQEEDNFDKY